MLVVRAAAAEAGLKELRRKPRNKSRGPKLRGSGRSAMFDWLKSWFNESTLIVGCILAGVIVMTTQVRGCIHDQGKLCAEHCAKPSAATFNASQTSCECAPRVVKCAPTPGTEP